MCISSFIPTLDMIRPLRLSWLSWKQHDAPEDEEEDGGVKEEAGSRGAATDISNCE